jgi:hypothetical protein
MSFSTLAPALELKCSDNRIQFGKHAVRHAYNLTFPRGLLVAIFSFCQEFESARNAATLFAVLDDFGFLKIAEAFEATFGDVFSFLPMKLTLSVFANNNGCEADSSRPA